MQLQIDVYKDYVMIGTQRVNREPAFPAGEWRAEWEYLKRIYLDDRSRDRY